MTKEQFIAILEGLGACNDAIEYVLKHESSDPRVIYYDCPLSDWWKWLARELWAEVSVSSPHYRILQEFDTEVSKLQYQFRLMIEEQQFYMDYQAGKSRLDQEFARKTRPEWLILDKIEREKGVFTKGYDQASADYSQVCAQHRPALQEGHDQIRSTFMYHYRTCEKELQRDILSYGILPDWSDVILPVLLEVATDELA
jgi:hypothetical protein